MQKRKWGIDDDDIKFWKRNTENYVGIGDL